MRYSKQREIIGSICRAAACHPTAVWVYEQAKRELPRISLGTVYRNLAEMAEAGQLLALDVGDGSTHFDGEICPHAHFYCTSCRALLDMPPLGLPDLYGQAETLTGHRISRHELIFYGQCHHCIK